jgi:exosortase
MIDTQPQHGRFMSLWIASLAVFFPAIAQVTRLAWDDERYSHILLIPVISLLLIYIRRTEIFYRTRPAPRAGVSLLVLGSCFYGMAPLAGSWSDEGTKLLVTVIALVTVWVGAFFLCYGTQAFRQAEFALLFLLLMVPVPSWLLDKAVVALQHGSAEVAFVLFKLLRIPVLAEGVRFSLPGVDIEVAKECSGIRSCVSLIVASVLAGYVFLRSGYSRLFLALLAIPIAIVKNAVRITTISWLGLYVNRDFFFGTLHKRGGLLFALLALIMMLPFVYLFRGWESRMVRRTDAFGR